jgi:hypothetical protein
MRYFLSTMQFTLLSLLFISLSRLCNFELMLLLSHLMVMNKKFSVYEQKVYGVSFVFVLRARDGF